MNFHFDMSNHGTRVDTRMHRAAVVDVEADDCAPEGYQAHPETRQPVSCPPRARKVPTSLIGPLLGVLSLLVVALLAALALVWPA
jgi:hypothetical protein